jgi:ATP-binding cassette subfamily C protein CydC
LAAVAAWLIARASQMPGIFTLSVAVVAVRFFGIGRGVFRYTERLASHDLALRGMANLRTNLYRELAAGHAHGLVALRRGDLLARVGADVDAVGDLVVRALIPVGVATVVSVGSIVLIGVFLPWGGVCLVACLLLAAVLAPWLAARSARGVETRGATARAAVAATTLEILESSGSLQVGGRLPLALDDLRAADRDLARVNSDSGRISGLSAGIMQVAIGLAVLACLILGIPAVQSGSLAPTELAVVVLTPLAVFEAATALPGAAVQLRRSRAAAIRLIAMLDSPGWGGAEPPAAPGTSRTMRTRATIRGKSVQTLGQRTKRPPLPRTFPHAFPRAGPRAH